MYNTRSGVILPFILKGFMNEIDDKLKKYRKKFSLRANLWVFWTKSYCLKWQNEYNLIIKVKEVPQ